ncbi:alkaline phosphatase family protein [Kitasatospora sp. NPDC094011]|uniref:alkaline phosphatase family protein n=1 Tax=Kitasatospora sp. NPDC094011 TaxID=3364090 RepID=UPI0038216D7C
MTDETIPPGLPPSLLKAMQRPPAKGGLHAIKHVVLLMQENRSFDHYFGKGFVGVRGIEDRNAVLQPDGKTSILQQPGSDGPYRWPVPTSDADESLRHNWDTGQQAWHGGWYDRWVEAKKGRDTMGYYDQQEVVGMYRALAEKFTLCDAYHSSVMSETTSNRNYLFSGYTGKEPGSGKRVVGSDAHGREKEAGNTEAYDWKSYPELLEAGGVSWKVYQEWNNFYDNNLEFYAEFRRIARTLLQGTKHLRRYPSLFGFYPHGKDDPLPARSPEDLTKEELKELEEQVAKLSAADRSLYERGLARHPSAENGGGYKSIRGFVQAFKDDIANNALPQVSYLVASEQDSEHPGNSTPMLGQQVVHQVLDAIASNDEVWDSTVLLISYDENDGQFDHVPPPVPPREVKDEWVHDFVEAGQPLGLGVRVPMIAVSPWTVGGYVNSQVFDHTSQVRFLENWLGVRQPLISNWRRTVAGDLSSVFDFERTGAVEDLPADSTVRRARPLPYQPDVYGTLDAAGKRFTLRMSNGGKASAHLALYPYADEYEEPQHFDVLGTVEKAVPVAGGAYEFTLTGPNGFRREFAGSTTGTAALVDVASTVDGATRQLTLSITNRGTSALKVKLTRNAYGEAPDQEHDLPAKGQPVVVTWPTDDDAQGWYDLTLTVEQDDSYRRRLMGHIENGKESVSG